RDHPSVRDMRLDGERLVLQWTGPDESFIEVLGRLAERRMPVLEVRHRRGSLEDVFLELTRGDVE
ncbi:MAG TPA: hypothetical protein VK116_04940, partial [Planctomycetota bacterium]|nr:hypothetical protein [Planctomycetota bacterium]